MQQSSSRDSETMRSLQGYGLALVATFIAAVGTALARNALFSTDGMPPLTLFLASVALSAWYGGLGPGIFATALGIVAAVTLYLPSPTLFNLADRSIQSRLLLYLVAAILMDVLSESRTRAERRTRLQRAELRVTLESIGDAVISADRNGRIVFINSVAEKLSGWSAGEALNRPLQEVFKVINEESGAAIDGPAARVLRDGVIVGLANHSALVTRSGGHLPIDDSAAPIRDSRGRISGVVLVFRDVSQRRQVERERAQLLAAEQAARRSAEDAQARFAFLADASARLSAALEYEQALTEVTRLAVPRLADWCTIYMLAPDGSLQLFAREHRDPTKLDLARTLFEAQTGVGDLLRNVIDSGTTAYVLEVTDAMLRAATSDEERLAQVRALGVQSLIVVALRVRGRTLGTLTLAHGESGRRYTPADVSLAEDLGRRIAVAVDNAGLYRDAQRAIALRDEFLSVASHELKTPLTSLIGYAQMLERRARRDNTLNERDLHSLRMVVQQAFRLNQLIMGVLDVSRLQAGQLSIERGQVDLNALTRNITDAIQPTLGKHQLSLTLPAEPLIVEGDSLRLEQVLQNLIQNAVKYSPEGGAVDVTVERQNGSAAIAVRDKGIGIPPESMPQIFTRFYRAPNVEQHAISGMGIGLYVVKEIAQLHNGTVEVASAEGQGSTFTVRLPLAAAPPAPNGEQPPIAPSSSDDLRQASN